MSVYGAIMPREILIDWTTPSGSDHRSVMMFGQVSTAAEQRTALYAFLSTIKSQLEDSTSFTIETAGRELDDATGALTGVWSEGTSYTGVGVVSGQVVADSTQALMQWRTDHIVGSRFLQGRTFIPGLSASHLSNGNLDSTTITAWQAAGQALIDDAVQFGVWHRPTSGSGGVFWAADTASVWGELAVLRKRRS